MEHRELAYVVLEIADPSCLDGTLAEVVGLVAGEPTLSGARTWRNDERAQRLVITPGERNDAVAVGLAVADTAELERLATHLEGLGYAITTADAHLCAERRVDELISVESPLGITFEIVTGQHGADDGFTSALVPGGFLTADMGMGHAVFATMAFDETDRFITEGLGFTRSDYLEMEMAPGIELEVRFYHCNSRHHSLAVARAPFELPQQLHHLMFELRDRDDVGAAFDRLWATDLTIANGLGRHDNDGMFSFYLVTPAGFQIEIGHGARVISEPWTGDRRYDRISAWGHQPIAR